MQAHGFFGDFENADAFDPCGASKNTSPKIAGQTDGFKDLRAAIALVGVEMPIFEMTFRSPSEIALMYFFSASSGVTSARGRADCALSPTQGRGAPPPRRNPARQSDAPRALPVSTTNP